MGVVGKSRLAAGQVAAIRSALCLVLGASSLSGQAVVRGVLYHDSTGAPVRGRVMLVDPATDALVADAITDSIGQFKLEARSGKYQIAAVRDGFTSTLSAPVNLRNGERLTIRLPIAVGEIVHKIGVTEHTMPGAEGPSETEAMREAARTQGFELRRSAPGLHFTRADLQKSGFATLGEFLQGQPGVAVGNPKSAASMRMSRSDAMMSPASSRSSLADCHVGWFLDGHRMDVNNRIDPMTDALGGLQLETIDGVEIFRGVSEMPAEFAHPELRCGAIAIWTRRS